MASLFLSACEMSPPRDSRAVVVQPPRGTPDWCAISDDGNLVAFPVVHSLYSEFMVVSLNQNSAWVLFDSRPEARLSHAIFSPDGARIFYVHSSYPDWRGDVFSAPVQGGAVVGIPELTQHKFTHLKFSVDGDRLIYFREVDVPPLPGRHPDQPPSLPMIASVHEYSFTDSKERHLAIDAAVSPSALGIDSSGRVMFAAARLAERNVRPEDGVMTYLIPVTSERGPMAYYFARDEMRAADEIFVIESAAVSRPYAAFTGLSHSGVWAFSSSASRSGHTVVGFFEDAPRTLNSPDGVTLSRPCISADGNTLVAISVGGRVTPTNEHPMGWRTLSASELSLYVWRRGSADFERIRLNETPWIGRYELERGGAT